MDIDLEKLMIGDLHIHSRFSRACSKNINFENLVKWAKIKGLNFLGTGDFSHPTWFEEISQLKEKNGLYYYDDFPFIITGEISLIYTDTRGRRVHLVLLIPSLEIASKINSFLDTLGRRDYDGRPIFKMSCEEFTKKIKEISDDIEIIPAHIWTPWFGIYGSCSGYDFIKEAFGNQFNKIHAIETGISSDPKMNAKISELNDKSIVSFSDSHSFWPHRLGREATIFYKFENYKDLIKQIRENSFFGTIETDPAYGKYHFDGHRNCNFSCSPEKTKELNGICPICKKPLTIGVDYRIETLKDLENKREINKPFFTLLPLHEIISFVIKTSVNSKKVWDIYNHLISLFGNEFNILLKIEKKEFLNNKISEELVHQILNNREGKIKVKPGYDGEYGVIVENRIDEKLFFL
jgi:uncharacterized protein (TIGR00375 family)